MDRYIIGIDQSTQGTKAMVFDENGRMLCREDLRHRQIINEAGWVEHDPEEIWKNTLQVVKNAVNRADINMDKICAVGISNQRETVAAWNRATGAPVCNAIVWQCARGEQIAERIKTGGAGEMICEKTGLPLSPYFSAAKMAWIMENVPEAKTLAAEGNLCLGTMDSYLVYRLTDGTRFQSDYSNSCRTQLFNIQTLSWDSDAAQIFGVPLQTLPQVTPSDGDYGTTDFDGFLPHPVPICGVMGDSHAALFGQGCLTPGMIKATYGTGSSIMMNVGGQPVRSAHGVVSSLAWFMDGKAQYVLEGNINYTGAVISWLVDDLQLIHSPGEATTLSQLANQKDHAYVVPAFTGLGAPYWDAKASAAIIGMTRTTGRNEIVKAAVECIAYQIADIVRLMEEDAGIPVSELRVDGGPTGNPYLMQFQADILSKQVLVPDAEELSGIGAAYCAGIAAGIYDRKEISGRIHRSCYHPQMEETLRKEKLSGWDRAVKMILSGGKRT